MKSDAPVAADVLIVGGGFSGSMLAAQLERRGLSSIVVEGRGRAGRGTAFSTPERYHLLNLPARRMSAWADQPDDFVDAVAGEGFGADDYVPRPRFGDYLRGIFDEVLARGRVGLVEKTAVSAAHEEDGWTVALDDGRALSGKALVVAAGNLLPDVVKSAGVIAEPLYIGDPWGPAGREAIARVAASGGDVLIIGTGLTMVDVALSLDGAGHRGRILALSRRGLTPRGHAQFDPALVERGEVPHGSLTALWRWVRRRAAEVGWRAVIDSIRPHSHGVWQSLSEDDRRRFLRHARPWWDVHRHRIAPQVSAKLKEMIVDGRLEIMAGRIVAMGEEDGRLSVELRRRGHEAAKRRTFDVALNCTGPLHAIERTSDKLIRSLLDAGMARPDPIGISLDVDERDRLVGGTKAWALGALTKGRYWEIIAVPDISHQVKAVADDIAKELLG